MDYFLTIEHHKPRLLNLKHIIICYTSLVVNINLSKNRQKILSDQKEDHFEQPLMISVEPL